MGQKHIIAFLMRENIFLNSSIVFIFSFTKFLHLCILRIYYNIAYKS